MWNVLLRKCHDTDAIHMLTSVKEDGKGVVATVKITYTDCAGVMFR